MLKIIFHKFIKILKKNIKNTLKLFSNILNKNSKF